MERKEMEESRMEERKKGGEERKEVMEGITKGGGTGRKKRVLAP